MKKWLTGIILIIAIIVLIVFSKEAKNGAINGFKLCTEIIIPSLLPIMILCSTLCGSKGAIIFDKLFGKIFQKIFGISKISTNAIIFGFIGGYPTGALLTSQLYENGLIEQKEATKIMRFNFCGGIAFIITTVGTSYLGNEKAGIAIFCINTISNISIALIDKIIHKSKGTNFYNIKVKNNCSDAFIKSIESVTKNILTMSIYIIFFSAIINMIPIPKFTYPFIEITNGIFQQDKVISFPYLCFFLSFGGLCVHFQVMSITKNIGMKYYDFFISRLSSGILSYFLGKGYMMINNNSDYVFSNISTTIPKSSQVSIKFGIMLLIGCVVIIIDLKNKKSKLI